MYILLADVVPQMEGSWEAQAKKKVAIFRANLAPNFGGGLLGAHPISEAIQDPCLRFSRRWSVSKSVPKFPGEHPISEAIFGTCLGISGRASDVGSSLEAQPVIFRAMKHA